MLTDRFWSSPASWPYQRAARQIRERIALVHVEPVAKGLRGNRVSKLFQAQAREDFGLGGRRPMTGPVALDLSFVASRRNPPAIQKIAKWALDVLGAWTPDARGRPRHVLYHDDRQVKLLHVHLRQAWTKDTPESGYIFVRGRPVRDVVGDLQLAQCLLEEDDIGPWDLDIEDRRVLWADVFEDEDDGALDAWDDNEELWEGDSDIDRLIRDWQAYQRRQRLQLSLLTATDRLVARILCQHPGWIAGAGRGANLPSGPQWDVLREKLAELEADAWRFVVSFPIIPTLPPLPESDGGHERFLSDVRHQLEEFVRRWPVLSPLLVPLKITLLVTPPAQGKDLDNIALDVLPIAHEVFKPHIEPWLLAPSISGDDPHRTEAEQRLRSLNAVSVTSYEVIELQRPATGAAAGLLRLALGRGDDPTSTWQKATDFVDECLKRI